jgi:hypothetical protein
MAKVKKGASDSEYPQVIDFKPESITAAPPDTYAVYDEGDSEWAVFPVILFAVGTLKLKGGSESKFKNVANAICGMVSNVGGLVMVEHAVDMKFVGYWKKEVQSLSEFLEDHDIDAPPDYGDDEDDE